MKHDFPYARYSVLAACYKLHVPATVHIGIGCDIVHEQPEADGAALGEATYTDFLIYAHTIENLENGVFLNFGSAVIGPEVYLKALSMARNVAKQEGRSIGHFTTAVFDLAASGGQKYPMRRRRKATRAIISALEDHHGAHRGRREGELLCAGRAPRHCACTELAASAQQAVNGRRAI